MSDNFRPSPDPVEIPTSAESAFAFSENTEKTEKENPYHPSSGAGGWRNPSDRVIEIQPLIRLKRARAILGDQYWLFVGICFVAMLIGSAVPFGLLAGPMACGTFICYRNRMLGRSVKFEELFQGFNFFADSVIAFLMLVVVMMVLAMPIGFVFMAGFMGLFFAHEAMGGAVWFFSFLALYLFYFVAIIGISAFAYVPFTFAFPLIVDRSMKGMDAFKLSWQTAKPMLFPLMSMYLVYGFLMAIASMMCYLPVFLLMPLVMGAVFTLYEDIFGMNTEVPIG